MKFLTKPIMCLFSMILLTAVNTNIAYSASNQPVLLSNPNNTGFERFRIDPSNQYIVFNEFDSNGVLNRFSSKLDNSSPLIQIASDLSSSEDTFLIDADTLRVFNRLNTGFISTEIDSSIDPIVYSVFDDDLQQFKPRGSLLSLTNNTDKFFFHTSDGQVYSLPKNGSGSLINYTETLNTTNDGLFRISSDKLTLFFATEIAETSTYQLFSAPTDGSTDPTFITELPENTDVDFIPRISSDNQRVVYITETFLAGGVETLQLFSAPLDGSSEPVALSEPSTGASTDIDFFISDNNSSVVFITEDFTNNEESIFVASIDGSFETRLIDSGSNISQFIETDNNQTLIYSITDDSNSSFIKSIPINSSGSTEPNTISNAVSTSINFVLSPDQTSVFYVGEFLSRIFRANIGSNSSPINIIDFNIKAPSDLVVVDDKLFFIESFDSQLYSSSLDGADVNLISSPFNANGDFIEVTDFEISDEGRFAVYSTSGFNDNSTSLFSVRLKEEVQPLCFPIKAKNGNFVTICL